jgi:hypothetical protein
MSRQDNNVIAIALSASCGAVMIFNCKQVNRADAKVKRFKLSSRFDNNVSINNSILQQEFCVADDAPWLYKGQDVLVGLDQEEIKLTGRVIAVDSFPDITVSRVNRSTDKLSINDVDTIMFINLNEQKALGKGRVESDLASLIDPIETHDSTHGFDLLRTRLENALVALNRAEEDFNRAGFVSNDNAFSFSAVEDSDHEVRLIITGTTSLISENDLLNRINAKIRRNCQNAHTLREKLAERSRLEEQLAKVNSEIAEAR